MKVTKRFGIVICKSWGHFNTYFPNIFIGLFDRLENDKVYAKWFLSWGKSMTTQQFKLHFDVKELFTKPLRNLPISTIKYFIGV